MTPGTIAGIYLVSDLLTGRHNPWATLYDPSRKTLRAAVMVSQYADWVTPCASDDIAPGRGAVFRRGLKKVAVYRDEHRAAARVLGHLYSPRLHRKLNSLERT
jgi:hypothetical protein